MRSLLLFLLLSLSSSASTYYVATTGDDSDDGSIGTPWLTMTKAVSSAAAGDTILVQSGIYDERVKITKALTFRANGDVTNKCYMNLESSGVTIDGFNMTGNSPAFPQQGAFQVDYAAVITNGFLINNKIHDMWQCGNSSGALYFTEHNRSNNVSGLVFSNNICSNFKSDAGWISLRGTNHVVVNNVFSNTFGSEAVFRPSGRGHIIRGNVTYNAGQDVFLVSGCGDSSFDAIYHSVWWTNAIHTTLPNTYLWKHPTLDHYVVRTETPATYGYSNTFNIMDADFTIYASAPTTHNATNYTWTMWNVGIVSPPTTSYGGTSHADWIDSDGPDIVPPGEEKYAPTTASYGIIIENNIVYGVYAGQIAQNAYPGTNNTTGTWAIRNNIFIEADQGIGIGYPNCKVNNNTFIRCGNNGSGSVVHFDWNDEAGIPKNRAYGGEIKNNIFFACGDNDVTKGWYSQAVSGSFTPSPDLLTNCNWNFVANADLSGKTADTVYPSSSPYKFYEPNGINGGDPKFANPSVYNYYLQTGSPLIDTGTALLGIIRDFAGTSRPQNGTNDIGAFEHDPALQMWLDFDVDFAATNYIADITGYTHHALQMDSTNWLRAVTRPGDTSAGQWTNVGTIDGYPLSQYAAITNLTSIAYLTNGTITCWLSWPTNTLRYDKILDAGADGCQASAGSNAWTLQYGTFGTTYASTGAVFGVYDTTNLNTGRSIIAWDQPRDLTNVVTWKHVAVTWNAANNRVVGYANGYAFQTNTLGFPWLRVNTTPGTPWIGMGTFTHNGSPEWGDDGQPNSGFFMGTMDDVRIYNRALSADEIESVYRYPMGAGRNDPAGRNWVRMLRAGSLRGR